MSESGSESVSKKLSFDGSSGEEDEERELEPVVEDDEDNESSEESSSKEDDAEGANASTGQPIEKNEALFKACARLQDLLKLEAFAAPLSKKRKSVLDMHVPGSKQVKALPDASRKEYIAQLTKTSMKLVTLVTAATRVQNSILFPSADAVVDSVPDIADVIVEDLELNQKTSVKQQYVEMGLWRKIFRANMSTFSRTDNLLKQNNQSMSRALGDATFREYYMSTFTKAFGGELDSMRQEVDMNEKKMAMLIKSIENGTDIFTGLDKELCAATYSVRAGDSGGKRKRGHKGGAGATTATKESVHSKAAKY